MLFVIMAGKMVDTKLENLQCANMPGACDFCYRKSPIKIVFAYFHTINYIFTKEHWQPSTK